MANGDDPNNQGPGDPNNQGPTTRGVLEQELAEERLRVLENTTRS